jgi:hypothetical protein
MSFREIVPSIVLLDRISAVTRRLPITLGQRVRAEEPRLLAVHFLRPLSARE